VAYTKTRHDGGHFPFRKSETAFFSLAAVSYTARLQAQVTPFGAGIRSLRETHVQVDSLLVLAPDAIQAGIKSVSGAPAPVGRNVSAMVSRVNNLATPCGHPQAEPLKVLPGQALERQHLMARLNRRIDPGRNHQSVQAARGT
jgi:hypothetical protein